MFTDPTTLAAPRLLESSFQVIRDEYRNLHRREFVPWPERFLYGEGWSVFGLYAAGTPIEYACSLCPQTASILGRIDSLAHAGFSRLAPGTHIKPHTGRPKSELRCHLAIEIPEGDLGIRVGSESRTWQAGKCLVFDDTLEHEAWNHTTGERIVLLLDFQLDHHIRPI